MNCPRCGTELEETSLDWQRPEPRPKQMVCMECPERFFVWDEGGALIFLEASRYEVMRMERRFARLMQWFEMGQERDGEEVPATHKE